MLPQLKIALVHDDFVQAGGAESLFATIASIWPDAPIYTSLVNWNKLPQSINPNRAETSFMQKIPFATKFYKLLLPLYPLAFESFNFDDFDLVISSTTRFAKSAITKPKTIHICYLNSLPRFLWDRQAQKNYLKSPVAFLARPFLIWLKRWDKVSSSRVDFYIANSENVARKLKKTYARESDVIHPFTDTRFFRPAKIHNWNLRSQKYFLIVTRLVKWKKVDIAIKAACNLGINLKIVGEGLDKERLKKIASHFVFPGNVRIQSHSLEGWIPNQVRDDRVWDIEFLGRVTREQLRQLYQNCQALIITQEEDFGIAAVEAQACCRPVIAYAYGGQREIVRDGKTGLFFDSQNAQSLQDAIRAFFKVKWSVSACRKNALRFSKEKFIKDLRTAINSHLSEIKKYA